MSESAFERIQACAAYLNIDVYTQELALFMEDKKFSEADLKAVLDTFEYLKVRKQESIVATLLRMSRLPLKEPKTFEDFDFSLVKGKNVDALRGLATLAALHAHKNIAFIGPQGVGKTHLAMAYGRACCMSGYKTYFLKATELNQRLTDARKYGHESSTINGLVKPSCLIVDEVGRCVFSKENTRMFFDIIDRRYNKEGPNTLILTSNIGPDKWSEFFSDDDSLLCSLDRIFDTATVFMMKGQSYRGRKCETMAIETGSNLNLSVKN